MENSNKGLKRTKKFLGISIILIVIGIICAIIKKII